MLDSCEPIRNATDDCGSDRDRMSDECSHCGDAVPTEDWHPVATVRTDDGELEVHLFCSETCQSSWNADHGDD
jgi:tellurite resistance-related uncharacterized protein